MKAFGLLLVLAAAAPAQDYQRKTLAFEGRERSYYVHLPPAYDGRKPLPLLVLLHGGGGNATQALKNYPLAEVADRRGFILVAPNGLGPTKRELLLTWNVGFGFGYAQRVGSDDNGFVRALILKLRQDLAVDPARVYLTGLSNGAMLCHRAGAANADLVAGIAPVVGAAGGREREAGGNLYPSLPQKPLRVILFNGEQDRHVPLQGGAQQEHLENQVRYLASADESARFWVRANGCKSEPLVEKLPEQKATRYTWTGGRQPVVLYVLHNQGHAWPGGEKPRAVADPPSPLLKAHEILWDFFSQAP